MAYLYDKIASSKTWFYSFSFLIILSVLLLVLIMLHYSQRRIIKKHTEQKMDYHPMFEKLLSRINDHILNGDLVNAKKEYAKLSMVYNKIRESSLSNTAKTEYYNKLSAVYSQLYKIIYRFSDYFFRIIYLKELQRRSINENNFSFCYHTN